MFDGKVSQADADQLRKLVSIVQEARNHQYSGASKVIILGCIDGLWRNLLTTVEFLPTESLSAENIMHQYADVMFQRQQMSVEDAVSLLVQIVSEGFLHFREQFGNVPIEGRFVRGTPQPRGRTDAWRQWSRWPADVFEFEPQGVSVVQPPSGPFVSLKSPYFRDLGDLLREELRISSQNWASYLRGAVVAVVPDFTARISELVVGPSYLRGLVECKQLRPSDLTIKVLLESESGPLARETQELSDSSFHVEVADTPTCGSIVLFVRSNNEPLETRRFDRRWMQQPEGITFEGSALEIEQMLLIGENESVEFRSSLKHPQRIARTAVAFANTDGGTIVVGVDDEHHVIGCDTKGADESVTMIVRNFCDPPVRFKTEKLEYQTKPLLLIRVERSKDVVHSLRENGVFIRASASDRAPTTHELRSLMRERKQI